jgi:DNA-directed RNA polymerase specialized sigma subunit, sigma24 homolog
MYANNYVNVFDNEKCYQYLTLARSGDRMHQKILYEALEAATNPIRLCFYNRAMACGINYEELDNLCSRAFLIIYNRYNVNLGSVFVYYKFIYTNLIRDEIRRNLQATARQNFIALGYKEDAFDVDQEPINASKESDIKKSLESTELVHYILDNGNVSLDEKESLLLKFYIEDYSYKEISDNTNLEYAKVIKIIKTALRKVRNFIKVNIPDIEITKK